MKRSLGSSDSLGALMSIRPTTDEQSPRTNHVYSREFQTMLEGLDEEGCIEESGHVGEKKRRLSVEQVKALEKNFEVENKLEPERKVKLAQELGLQPRQVAVWFQNRRARWKTKQLERDYGVLKSSYEALKINYESLQHDNEALLKEIRELKSKLNEANTESNLSVKDIIVPKTEDKSLDQTDTQPPQNLVPQELNFETLNDKGVEATLFADIKDGSSDSDSSAILNEDNSPNGAISSSNGVVQTQHLLMSPSESSLKFECANSSSSPSDSMNCFSFTKSSFQASFVKMEEHNFFSGEDACNFFSDDQAPSLQWYSPDQWN